MAQIRSRAHLGRLTSVFTFKAHVSNANQITGAFSSYIWHKTLAFMFPIFSQKVIKFTIVSHNQYSISSGTSARDERLSPGLLQIGEPDAVAGFALWRCSVQRCCHGEHVEGRACFLNQTGYGGLERATGRVHSWEDRHITTHFICAC